MKNPTIYPDLNAILRDLVGGIRALLGENFLSAYLQGSFAVGDSENGGTMVGKKAMRELYIPLSILIQRYLVLF